MYSRFFFHIFAACILLTGISVYAQISPVVPGVLCWNTGTNQGSANYMYSSYRTLDYWIDGYGNSYTAGYELGPNHSSGDRTYSFIITKYDKLGQMEWERDHIWNILYQPNDDFRAAFVTGITADDNKNVYVCGQFYSEKFKLDTFEFSYTSLANRGFVAQLDSNGIFKWVAILDANSGNRALTSLVFTGDKLYVSQWGAGTLRLPDGSVQVPNYPSSIVVLDAFGNFVNDIPYTQQVNDVTGLRAMVDPSTGYAYGDITLNPRLHLAPSGDIYLVSRSRNSVSFGTTTLFMPQTAAVTDLKTWCARLNTASGWQSAFLLTYTDKDYDVDYLERWEIVPIFTADAMNNVYYAEHWETLFAGPNQHQLVCLPNGDTLAGEQSDASWIAKYSPTGVLLWETYHSDIAWASLAAGSNCVYAYGMSKGSVEINSMNNDSIQFSNTGLENITLAQMDTSGNFSWAQNFGGQGVDLAYHLRKSPCSDNFFFTGLQSAPYVLYNVNDTLVTAQADQVFLCKHSTISSCTDPVCATPNGVAEQSHLNTELLAYPNPCSSFLSITGLPQGEFYVHLIDVSGRIVFVQTVSGNTEHTFALDGIAPGIYLMQVANTGYQRVSRVVVE